MSRRRRDPSHAASRPPPPLNDIEAARARADAAIRAAAQPLSPEAKVVDLERRLDRWVNYATGLGTFEDKTRAASFEPPWRLSDVEITGMVSGNDLAAKCVEKRPGEMMRRGYTLEGHKPGEIDKGVIDELTAYASEDLLADTRMQEGMIAGRQYGGSLLVLGINDGRAPDEPVDEDNIQSIDFMNLVDRRFAYVESYYSQLDQAQLGQAQSYLISNAIATTSYRSSDGQRFGYKKRSPGQIRKATPGASILTIHESRTIRFDGVIPDIITRQTLAGWSWSVLQRPYEILRMCDGAFDALSYLITDASQGVLKLKGLFAAISGGKEQKLQQRIDTMDRMRSVMHTVALDADGQEDFSRVSTPLSGIPESVDRIMQRLAAAMDMPLTELFGMSPAGMNATGESDRIKWYDTIATEQQQHLAPKLKRLYRLISLAQDGPCKGKGADFKIKFHPLYSPTDDELSKTRLANAQRDLIYINAEAVTAQQVTLTLTDIYPSIDADEIENAIDKKVAFDPMENDENESAEAKAKLAAKAAKPALPPAFGGKPPAGGAAPGGATPPGGGKAAPASARESTPAKAQAASAPGKPAPKKSARADETHEHFAGEFGAVMAAKPVVMRPKGWEAHGDEVEALTRPGHVYRGMSEDEFQSIGTKGKIESDGRYNLGGDEGTNFADSAEGAESYTNYGHTDPRKTGQPNYLVEVHQHEGLKLHPDGYWKAPSVDAKHLTRAWRMTGEDGAVIGRQVSVGPKADHLDRWNPEQPRGANGQWTEEGAVSASRTATELSRVAMIFGGHDDHSEAAKAHTLAATAAHALAGKHEALGNVHAAEKFRALAVHHEGMASSHSVEAEKLRPPPPRPAKEAGPSVAKRVNPARSLAAYKGHETRGERDEAVRVNLPPHLHPLWERTKGQFKGDPQDRVEQFTKYAEEHPHEGVDAMQSSADDRLEKLIEEYQARRADAARRSVQLHKDFDPAQPRAANGQWGEGGAEGSSDARASNEKAFTDRGVGIGYAGGSGPKQTADALHRLLPGATVEGLEKAFGGDKATAKIEGAWRDEYSSRDQLEMKGHLETADGKKIGDFVRTLYKDSDGLTCMSHDSLYLNKEAQGQGIGKSLLRSTLEFEKAHGIAAVTLQTAEIGKYVWAEHGFNWGEETTDRVLPQFASYVERWGDVDRSTARRIARAHAGKAWELAAVVVNGKPLGKNYLLGRGEGSINFSYHARLNLKDGDAGYEHAKKVLAL